MNKKGNFGFILLFFIIIAVLIVAAFTISILSGVVNLTADTIIPEIESIGMVGDSNVTQYAQYGTAPVTTLINSFSWMGGLAYFIAVIGLLALAVTYRMTMNKVFIVLFFLFAIMIIFLSILVSNMYEDIYTPSDELALELKSQTLLSYMILRSPMIFSIVIFIAGIILFSGAQEEAMV